MSLLLLFRADLLRGEFVGVHGVHGDAGAQVEDDGGERAVGAGVQGIDDGAGGEAGERDDDGQVALRKLHKGETAVC